MIKPLNGFVQVEPQTREDFISSADTTYNEVGTVIAVADEINSLRGGETVYFDSWMATKFPAGDGKYYWLVPFENIKAYEQIPTEQLQGGLPAQIQDTTFTQSGVGRTV